MTNLGKPAPRSPALGEMMINKRQVMRLAAAAALAGAWVRSAAAQAKMVFKASDVHPEGYPTVAAVEEMCKALDKTRGGSLPVPDDSLPPLLSRKVATCHTHSGA